tara:strand:- start:123 stop:983 length:861 start_codon:yes stop_codon:yes gene_type:complete
MLQSMTGYGSDSFKIDDFEINIELRTLNSRYFDSKISLPPTLYKHELEINNLLKKFLVRGKVELNIKFLGVSEESFSFNKNVIKNYFKDLNDISKFDKSQLLNSILNLPNTITKSESKMPEKVLKKNIIVSLNSVIKELISFRTKEGQNTKKDLAENIKMINTYSEKIKKESKYHKKSIEESLEKKVRNLNVEYDHGKFEQEMFYYLEKIDINEELVRLSSHVNFFNEILKKKSIEKGKKLGFICQEMGREINTIGSKSNNSLIQNHVVEMKSSVEKIREQLLNIL